MSIITSREYQGLRYQIIGNHLSIEERVARAKQVGSFMGVIQRKVYERQLGLERIDTGPYPDANTDEQMSRRLQSFSSPHTLWVAAVHPERGQFAPSNHLDAMVGFIKMNLKHDGPDVQPDEQQDMLEIEEVNVISKEHRGKGVASTLVATACGLLVLRKEVADNEPIYLEVVAPNMSAKAFHAKNGFRRTQKDTAPNGVFAVDKERWESSIDRVTEALSVRGTISLAEPLLAMLPPCAAQ